MNVRALIYTAPWLAMAAAQTLGGVWPHYCLTHGLWWPAVGRLYGNGDGYNNDYGDGDGYGYGDGDGDGSGSGYGYGYGSGYGYGDGDGDGDGSGSGSGYGYGDGKPWNKQPLILGAEWTVAL